MIPVALGLGSNRTFSQMSPPEILGGALREISKTVRGIKISSLYRTKAMYVTDQQDFYNMALTGFVPQSLDAHSLLQEIHRIEAMFGRDRASEIRFGPRSLDIDIEFFGQQKINLPDLEIPHPRLKERAFVLIPLLEIMTGARAGQKFSAYAKAQSADNISGKNFCFDVKELAQALAALGGTDSRIKKIKSAEAFSRIVKMQRCDYGTDR